MVSKESRAKVRVNKHRKLRNRFSGTAERPRLAVFRSNNHMYAQIIDDTVGNTLVSASLEQSLQRGLWKKASQPLSLTEAALFTRARSRLWLMQPEKLVLISR